MPSDGSDRPVNNEPRYTSKSPCSKTGCKETYFPDKWGNMEAQRLGWFMQRNGDAWCPDHIPAWVAKWRAKREESQSDG